MCPEFSHSRGRTIKNLYLEPFQSCNILNYSRVFKFRTNLEFLNSGPFQNFHILDHSRIFTFWTIPELSHAGPFQNFNMLDSSRIFTFCTDLDISYIIDNNRMLRYVRDMQVMCPDYPSNLP